MTKYSRQILDLINSSNAHLTAEQIFLELKKRESKAVLATVYNNLNSLCDGNMIRRISVEGLPDMYDKIKKHDHLICKKCGRLADFCFEDLTDDLQKQMGGGVLGYDLKVFYVCNECSKPINKKTGVNYEQV